MAAVGGEASAQYRLGVMYKNGEATPQNYHDAMVWYRKAAEQGHWGAQMMLADMYWNGLGVAARDYVRAYMWESIAASQGGGAEARDAIGAKMTPAQIAQAQEMAQRCYSSNYKNCD